MRCVIDAARMWRLTHANKISVRKPEVKSPSGVIDVNGVIIETGLKEAVCGCS
jgi:hypothetical protein